MERFPPQRDGGWPVLHGTLRHLERQRWLLFLSVQPVHGPALGDLLGSRALDLRVPRPRRAGDGGGLAPQERKGLKSHQSEGVDRLAPGHPSFGGRSHRLTDRDKVFLGTEYCQVGVLDAGPCPQSRNYLALPPRTLSQLEAGDPVDLLDRKFGSFSDIHAGRVKDGLHSKISCESHGVLIRLWCI